MVHYVYRLTHKPSARHYIGVRSSTVRPEKDLGVIYWTSSKTVRPLFRAQPDQFTKKIIRTFETRESAWLFEHRLLRRVGVPRNKHFFNKAVWSDEHVHLWIGREQPPFTEERKRKIRRARRFQSPPTLGRTMSDETKRKIGNANRGRRMPDSARAKLSRYRKLWWESRKAPKL